MGIDGVPFESINQIKTPALDRLHIIPAMTGGYTGEASEGVLSSAPGWMTILTGVWANKHEVLEEQTPHTNRQFPSLFQHIKMAQPHSYIASVIHWPNITEQYLHREIQHIDYRISSITDAEVTEEVVRLIRRGQPDFIFVQLDETDTAGHTSGFSEEFDQAVQKADNYLGKMLDEIELRRMKHPEEEWLVLAVSDHGRDSADGHMHGMTEPQDVMEKTVFIASNKPVAQGLYPLPDDPAPHALTPVTAVVPTVLQHLDVHIYEDMLLDGTSIFTKDAPARLKAKCDAENNALQLDWHTHEHLKSEIDVYCNHQLIATLEPSARSWTFPCPVLKSGNNVFDLSVVIDGMPLSTRLSVDHYQAAPFNTLLVKGLKHCYDFGKGIADQAGSNDMVSRYSESAAILSSESKQARPVLAIDRSKGYFSIPDTFSSQSFTIGFWLWCTPTDEDVLILGPKDWSRGINKGWAFKTRSGGIRFNMADDVNETFNKGIKFTQNQWVYVAAAVDREQQVINVHVGDSIYRMQSETLPLDKLADTFIQDAMIGFNEDGTGTANQASKKNTVMKFADIAIWDRPLAKTEVEAIFRSGSPVSSLIQ